MKRFRGVCEGFGKTLTRLVFYKFSAYNSWLIARILALFALGMVVDILFCVLELSVGKLFLYHTKKIGADSPLERPEIV